MDKCAPFYVGGYEIRVYELAKRLSKRHEVRIYTSVESSVFDGSLQFIRICSRHLQRRRSGKRSYLHSLIFSLKLLRNPIVEWSPDVIVVEAIPYLQLKFMKKWHSQINCFWILDVVEAWNSYAFHGRNNSTINSMIRWFLWLGISWCDLVTTISTATADSLKSNYGVPESKLFKIPLGVDIQRNNHLSKMDKNAIDTMKYDVITVGRMVKIKHHQDILNALWLLKKMHGWSGKAVFVGDGPLKKSLLRQCNELDLTEQIDFKGLVSDDEKFDILLRSNIFILASEREGFSLATLEALSVGLPAIVAVPVENEVFGVSDIVKDGFNGLYFKLRDCEELSEKILQLLSDKNERRKLGENARQTALGYDWNYITNKFEETLRTMEGCE